MNIFYNKKVFPNVLFITLQHTINDHYQYEYIDNITIIKNDKGQIIGLNIFDVQSLNIEDTGSINLTDSQMQNIQDKLNQSNIKLELTNGQQSKFIVGCVQQKDKHPNADKLSICQVNIGEQALLQIVCGASNVDVNQKVVVATIGAVMPSGLIIQPTKLRGVDSFGMLCSAKELGLPQEQPGILVLSDNEEVGKPFII